MVPGSKHFAEQLLPVIRVIGGLVVLRQGNLGGHTVREASGHVIDRVAIGIDAGVDPDLVRVLPLAGQLDHRAGAVGAAFPGFPGLLGGDAAVPRWEAAVGSYDGLVAYLARTFRALYECHIHHAPVCKMGIKKYTCTDGCIDGIIGLVEGLLYWHLPVSVHAVPGGARAAFCA